VPYERRIAAPLLVVGSRGDPLVDEADVDLLRARASSTEKRAVLVDDAGHGWSFLQGSGANPVIRDAVADFLTHAGAPVATCCA
jgi:alpha-beta hydrolase superfamily lysophospholipase